MDKRSHRYCVIMCGGIGSRFWPYSRTRLPKQFIDFLGTGRTLLQMSYDRISNIIPAEKIVIMTNGLYADLVREQLPMIAPSQILLEPAPQHGSLYRLGRMAYCRARQRGLDDCDPRGPRYHT